MRKIKFKDVFIIKDLISYDDLSIIQEYLKSTIWIDGEADDPNQHCQIDDKNVGLILENARDSLMKEIEKDFDVSIGKEEMGTIVKYTKGWVLQQHYDQLDMLPTFAGYPTRDLSSLIYLSENFEGGNLVFPELDINIEPIAGSAVYFPGTKDYVHEVAELINGDRIAITTFWHALKT